MIKYPEDRELLTRYFHECIEIAKRGEKEKGPLGRLFPPYAGCVILDQQGNKISEGWRSFVSGSNLIMHAERHAIHRASGSLKGATLITTLEPCSRHKNAEGKNIKKTMQHCNTYIVQEGIKQVFFGCRDPIGSSRSYFEQHSVSLVHFSELAELINYELFVKPIKEKNERKQSKLEELG